MHSVYDLLDTLSGVWGYQALVDLAEEFDQAYLTGSVYNVVLQKSIPAQIPQRILCYH